MLSVGTGGCGTPGSDPSSLKFGLGGRAPDADPAYENVPGGATDGVAGVGTLVVLSAVDPSTVANAEEPGVSQPVVGPSPLCGTC